MVKKSSSLKSLFLLLSLVAIMMFAVACSSEKSTVDDDKKEDPKVETPKQEVVVPEEPIDIEIVVNNYGRNFPSGMSENENPYLDFIQENTNLNITVQVPPAEGYMERLNVLMAGRDLPDMIYSPDANWFVNFVNQKALTPLSSIIEEHGQNLLKYIPEQAWQAVTIDGEIYAVPHILQEAGTELIYVRQDWLNDLGLDKPVTLDEYVEVLKAFKENYNNMGYIMTDHLGRISPMLGAFGVQRNQWVERDGKLVFSSTLPEMKEALAFLADLYEQGLFDREFPSNNLAAVNEKIANDRIGLYSAAWWDTRGPILTNKQNNEKAEWVSLDYPVGPNGHSGVEGRPLVRGYNAIPVTSDNAIAVVKMLDFLVSDGFRDIFLGFEGEVWEIKDGVASTDFEMHNEHLYRQMYNTVEPLDMETTKIRLDSLGLEFNLFDNVSKIAENVMVSEFVGPPTPSVGLYGAQLRAVEDEIFANIISGRRSIDEFDKFVERWYKEGGQQWTDEVNEWYKNR